MNTQPEQDSTRLAALYQVTARWYANDAQLIWRRITFFTTVNSGLLTAQVFPSDLYPAPRVGLAVIGICLSWYWFGLVRRNWVYQDFQKDVLRDQECAMGLGKLGVFSRVWVIRGLDPSEKITIANKPVSASELTGGKRNRQFMTILIWGFIILHVTLLVFALFGISLRASSTTPSPIPTATPTVSTFSATVPSTISLVSGAL